MFVTKEFLFEVVKIKKLYLLENGRVTVILPNDEVMSVQPEGQVETRPAGTQGAWEQAELCGDLLIFTPTTRSFAFGYIYE